MSSKDAIPRYQCPEPEVRGLRLSFGWGIVAAEALDRGENIVGRFGPAEGFWIGIVAGDEVVDGSMQGVDAAVNAASDLALGKQGEEPLDLVEPGRTGRGQMHMPARPARQPVADQRRLVRGIVVDDEMQSRSRSTFASISSRNLRNSVARWRAKHFPITRPVAMSRAAKS